MAVVNSHAAPPITNTEGHIRRPRAIRAFLRRKSLGHDVPTTTLQNLLHNFNSDHRERRQYQRIALQFPIWWLQSAHERAPAAGIGLEISGGGLQFLLQQRIESTASIAFQIDERRMRANIGIVERTQTAYKDLPWYRYRAKFVGVLDADFEFIIALTERLVEEALGFGERSTGSPAGAPHPPPHSAAHSIPPSTAAVSGADIASPHRTAATPRTSIGACESYDMLPARVQEQIVNKLVEMKRMIRPAETRLALLSAHYGGIQPANGTVYHRFFIRTRKSGLDGARIYNTEILISDDGTSVFVRE
jgi:hypothetical protein